MPTLAIKTDNPTAEIFLIKDGSIAAQNVWEAHRNLADTLLTNIDDLCKNSGIKYADLSRIAVYEGPGSFTGLRIGVSVANAFGNSLGIPVTASTGEDWLDKCTRDTYELKKFVTPQYGSEPTITAQKK